MASFAENASVSATDAGHRVADTNRASSSSEAM